MPVAYHPEHFTHIQPPDGMTSGFYIDGGTYPCGYCLNPGAEVTVFSDGSVRTDWNGGAIITGIEGSISFRSGCMGMEIETLNAPLILEAADRQGIPVRFRKG